jgi:hypothetical protein
MYKPSQIKILALVAVAALAVGVFAVGFVGQNAYAIGNINQNSQTSQTAIGGLVGANIGITAQIGAVCAVATC